MKLQPACIRTVHVPLMLVAVACARTEAASSQAPCPGFAPGDSIAPIEVVRYLADDRLEGRAAGSAAERCAGEYVAERMRRIGLEPGAGNGSYFQDVTIASVLNPHATAGVGRNVIGVLRGTDTAAERVLVVGAHYDHLGRGGPGSAAPDRMGEIHNGADDNASGVAVLLDVAERLAAERPARTVVFVAFTGEELGLLGSAHFVEHAPVPVRRMAAMLNLDMVGRLGERPLIVYGVGTAAEWRPLLERIAAETGTVLAYQNDGFGPSDHTSFYAADVPVLHFFTNTHGDYHRPSDDPERIDEAGLQRVGAVVAAVARAVAHRPMTLTLQRGAGTRPGAGGGYGAYLGTVPDFSPVETGVLLGGVSPGSPAEKAGLLKGDIIVGLGAHEVRDLQGMTDALRAHRPGDEVRVRYLRDGRALEVTVVLGDRARR
jgi:hypothetical protein